MLRGPAHTSVQTETQHDYQLNMRVQFIRIVTSQSKLTYTRIYENVTLKQRRGLHGAQWVGQFKTMVFMNFYLCSKPHPATAQPHTWGR